MSKLHLSYTTVKTRISAKFRYLLLALIAIGIGFAMTGLTKTVTPATAANSSKVRQVPAITHKLVASYYSVKENLNATLMLSNQGLAQLSVRVHLFSKSGTALDLPAFTLSGNEVRAVDLRQSIPAGSAFEEGSLEVNYDGRPLELGGVVALMNPAQSLMFEEELTEPARAADSTRLEGVWWRPTGNSEVRVALSNNSNAAVSVTVQTQGEGHSNSKTVPLAAHVTRILSTEDHNGNDELEVEGNAGGISINYTGAPGVVIAHGLIQEPSKGFSNVIDFADPQKSKLTRLDGTGLRFGSVGGQQLNQIVVLRNISNAPVTVSGRVPYTLSNGIQATATIQSFQLTPGDVKKMNLPSIASPDQITAAGLEFNYTGTIGSVIGSALSYSNDRNQVFRVPLRDAQVQASSTGTYPWSIGSTTSTMVYLKNVTNSPKQFGLSVRFAGGNYVLEEKTILAGQSISFDLRSLRDNQIPDGNGNVIPLNITNGQAHWSARGASKPMIGRAEQPDITNGMSMTSACGIYCPDSFLYAWMTPASASGFIGDTTQFTVFREMVDCFGNRYTQQYSPYNWSCDNPSVATVNQNGLATAVGVGSSNVRNPFQAFTYTDEGSYCSEYEFTAEPTASCTVQQCTISIQEETISPGTTTSPTLPIRNPAQLIVQRSHTFETIPSPSTCPVTWSVTSGPGSLLGGVNSVTSQLLGNSVGTILLRATTAGNQFAQISVPVVNMREVNVTVWIVRDSNGANAAVDQNRVDSDIADSNLIWQQCGIHFNLVNTLFIDNSVFLDPGSLTVRNQLRNTNTNTGGIELYYVNSFPDQAGTVGLTTIDGAIVRSNSESRTTAHELGHAMGLTGEDNALINVMYFSTSHYEADIRLNQCTALTRFTSN